MNLWRIKPELKEAVDMEHLSIGKRQAEKLNKSFGGVGSQGEGMYRIQTHTVPAPIRSPFFLQQALQTNPQISINYTPPHTHIHGIKVHMHKEDHYPLRQP